MKKIILLFLGTFLLFSIPFYADSPVSIKGQSYGIAGYDTGKNYSENSKSESANALTTVINSVYLSANSEYYKSLSEALNTYLKEFETREKLKIMINTVFPIYKADYSAFIETGKMKISHISYINPDHPNNNYDQTYYALLCHEDGSCAGNINLYYNLSTKKWAYGGYPGEESPERISPTPEWTLDFRTFSVEIYDKIKGTSIDLKKATAQYIQFMDDTNSDTHGTCFYFTDDTNVYLMPIGVQCSISPFAASYLERDSSIEYGLDSSGIISFYKISEFHTLAVKDKAYLESLPIQVGEEGNPYTGGFIVSTTNNAPNNDNTSIIWIVGSFGLIVILVGVSLTIRKMKTHH